MKQNGQNVALSSCEPGLPYKSVDTHEKCLHNVHEGLLNYCSLNGNSSKNLEYHGSFMVGTNMFMNWGGPHMPTGDLCQWLATNQHPSGKLTLSVAIAPQPKTTVSLLVLKGERRREPVNLRRGIYGDYVRIDIRRPMRREYGYFTLSSNPQNPR